MGAAGGGYGGNHLALEGKIICRFRLRGNISSVGEFLDRIVDEVEILDCALDDEDVRALYQSRYGE